MPKKWKYLFINRRGTNTITTSKNQNYVKLNLESSRALFLAPILHSTIFLFFLFLHYFYTHYLLYTGHTSSQSSFSISSIIKNKWKPIVTTSIYALHYQKLVWAYVYKNKKIENVLVFGIFFFIFFPHHNKIYKY